MKQSGFGVLFATLLLTRLAVVHATEFVKPALPNIPDRTFSLADFGAVGDGQTMNTDAFKKAIAAVEKAGGGKLNVPKGVFRTAPFTLCSNLDLHLADGAVIQAPDTFEALGLPHPSAFKTQAEADAVYHTPNPLISGSNLHDVALTGPGTIDGNRPNFKGDPTKIPTIRDIVFDHLTIEGSRNAGTIHGIPDSPITNIRFSDMTLTAEKDFDIRDAIAPIFERVTRTIKAGVAPPKILGEH